MENEDVRKTAYELAAELHEKRSNLAREIYQKEMTVRIHVGTIDVYSKILDEFKAGALFEGKNRAVNIWEAAKTISCTDYRPEMVLQDIIEGLQRRINGLQLEIDGLKVEFSEL